MSSCFHGGVFWDAIPLDRPTARAEIVNADVLDAWFPPAPAVVEALADPWLLQTSPPTHAAPMERAVAEAFGVDPAAILAGPGSSALLYLALPRWLEPGSRVLLVEPTYGEYAHLCELLGCRVERFEVGLDEPFDLGLWARRAAGCDLAVLVNPNNPSGHLLRTAELAASLLRGVRVLIDEAYLAYTNEPSAAGLVLENPSVAVVRSFSKSHALSGLRAAAMFAHPDVLANLRAWRPPWWVSLPAQAATVAALPETRYYARRYDETHTLRRHLAMALDAFEGAANWVLHRLSDEGLTAAETVARCAARGVFLRDAGRTAPSLGDRTLRIAVKPEWRRVVETIREANASVGGT